MPAGTANSQVMIDYLAERYGSNAAADRVLMLSWLQRAEETVWGLRDWWFRYASTTMSLASGTVDNSPSAACNNVLRVAIATFEPLTYVPPKLFDMMYRPNSTPTGRPTIYTVKVMASYVPVVSVWKKPDTGYTANIIIENGPTTLTDGTGSVTSLPSQYRQALLEVAEIYMMKHQGQIDQIQVAEIEKNTVIAAMIQENERHPKVMR